MENIKKIVDDVKVSLSDEFFDSYKAVNDTTAASNESSYGGRSRLVKLIFEHALAQYGRRFLMAHDTYIEQDATGKILDGKVDRAIIWRRKIPEGEINAFEVEIKQEDIMIVIGEARNSGQLEMENRRVQAAAATLYKNHGEKRKIWAIFTTGKHWYFYSIRDCICRTEVEFELARSFEKPAIETIFNIVYYILKEVSDRELKLGNVA